PACARCSATTSASSSACSAPCCSSTRTFLPAPNSRPAGPSPGCPTRSRSRPSRPAVTPSTPGCWPRQDFAVMDNRNRFHTPETWLWVRAEHVALLLLLVVLLTLHLSEVHWGRFVLAFLLIDLVGYLPGTVAYRRAGGGRIAPLYHHLYNLT